MHIQLTNGALRQIKAAVRELGVEAGEMDTPISILPETTKPWRHRFDVKALAQEERMLQSAAYILCAYLTGMRDCEVQAMQRGCLSLKQVAKKRSTPPLLENCKIRELRQGGGRVR
ncbi:hypothetical protein [Mesorhizobium sp. WSM2239]|uniref:Integrase n=1 Tax=Mesorhizobium sp. WSM2239 TaxID=3228852 RepID=A0AAU8D729_9HYPH